MAEIFGVKYEGAITVKEDNIDTARRLARLNLPYDTFIELFDKQFQDIESDDKEIIFMPETQEQRRPKKGGFKLFFRGYELRRCATAKQAEEEVSREITKGLTSPDNKGKFRIQNLKITATLRKEEAPNITETADLIFDSSEDQKGTWNNIIMKRNLRIIGQIFYDAPPEGELLIELREPCQSDENMPLTLAWPELKQIYDFASQLPKEVKWKLKKR